MMSGGGGGGDRLRGSSWGESIPDEHREPDEETEGEWEGCYRKFLTPISVGSRGVGETSTYIKASPLPPLRALSLRSCRLVSLIYFR